MGKERRVVGPTRRNDISSPRSTPYDRPKGGTQNAANAGHTDLPLNDRLEESNEPPHHRGSVENSEEGRRSSWSSWVYTPLKALRESFLSKSPIKDDEVDDNVDGYVANQTASSTVAAVVEEGEAHSQKAGDQYSSREQEAGPIQPIDMALPAHVLGNVPSVLGRLAAVTPSRPSGVSDSSYEDLLARNVALLSNSPLAAGSPFRPRARPGAGSQQPTPAQSSGAAGTPLGQAPLPMGNRPFHSVGPSRFGLRDGPAPSPLALTPAPQPFRATPYRGSRPFARTPIHMQPLSATVPASSAPAPAASAAAAPEPAPLSWTPMRTYSSMQPRGGAGLSLKRGRADGSPVGQPLLGAGLSGDSERRTRRRGEQGVGSAERRVWKAGQGPHKGPAGREVLAIEGPAATRATATPNGVAGSREPLPMTESARRIAMALDSMLPTSAPQGEAQPATTLTPQQPIPPPTDTLGVVPRPLPSAAPPPATSSLALPITPHVDAFPTLASSSWATQAQPTTNVVEQPVKTDLDTQRPGLVPSAPPAASWSTWTSRPTISLPVDMDFTAGTSQPLPTPNPDSAPLPLTPIVPSLDQSSFLKFSGAQKVEFAGENTKAATGAADVAQAKFSFRPARSLLDSAEKIRMPSLSKPVIPTPEKVIAENDRAAAAASQPLPVSDDDEDGNEDQQDGDGSEDGDIKGVMRSSARPKENGDTPATTSTAAPVSSAGGWTLDFLKKNQAQAAAATEAAEKAIVAERGGAQPEAQPQESASKGDWDSGFLKQNHAQAAAASEAAKKAIEAERGGSQPEPKPQEPAAKGGWDLTFLNANKAAVDAASAAAKAEVDKAAGKASSGPAPAPFTMSFGKPQTPATDSAASSGSDLLSFLGNVVPSSSSTAFAPSTSSGFTFGVQPAEASEPAATSALIPVAPAAKPMPSFLTSSMPASQDATENGDVPASDGDGPAKKRKSDEAPANSGGFKFGGGALPFSFPLAASTSAEAAGPAMQHGATKSGTAADANDVIASTAAADAPASTPAPLSFGLAASNGPASLRFGAGASQPASSSAAISPAPFSFGALSAPPAAASRPEAPARAPISFQLKPSAAPFSFGKPIADAGQQDGQKDGQKPPESEPAGLDITQAERGGSGRSLDSNMSVSPSAGAGAANPFVSLETGPAPEAATTSGFPVPSFLAPPSAAAASSFTFGASAAAASASSSGFPSGGVGNSLSFLSGSVPAFGAASSPAFGAAAASAASQPTSAPMGMFGANANSAFGAPAATPAFGGSMPGFGAAASTPAFGATQSGQLTFGAASAPAAFAASSTPAFGGSSVPAFGSSSTPAFGAGSASGFGAPNAAPFGQASAPAFGAGSAPSFSGFGSGGFSGGAAPPFGGFGGGNGAFGAQPQGAAAPFGAAHTAPAWGAAAIPNFGQPSAQANVDAAPGPFGAPAQPAFGMQQQQQAVPGNPFGFQGALSGGLGGDAASGFTMGAGDSQQQQQGQLARRKVKVKRKGPR